jgi:hypothetical protein
MGGLLGLPSFRLERSMRVDGRWPAWLAALALCVCGCGCGSSANLHPVKGQVLLNDQPVQGAKVIFQPAGEVDAAATNPAATTDAEGKFSVATYPLGDGAPPGEYVACVIVPPGAKASVGAAPLASLPNKYGSRETSGLAVKVQAGSNSLEPFRLTK